jgi:hypothetical protein
VRAGVLARPRTAPLPWRPLTTGPLGTALVAGALFLALATLFFLLIGRNPGPLFLAMLEGSFGSGYALTRRW